jgi:hypothetical protein
MTTCDGITYKRKLCCKPLDDEQLYCSSHLYFVNFSDEIIQGILNKTNDYKICGRCHHWHNSTTSYCTSCLECGKQHVKKKQEENADLKCVFIVRADENDEGHRCERFMLDNCPYCKTHERFKDYTHEMMANLKFCSECHYQDYLETYLTCEKCRTTRKKGRAKKSAVRKALQKCKKCDNPALENEYCGKHRLDAWLEDLHNRGFKECVDYVRGCKVELTQDYQNSKCEICLDKERNSDKKRRVAAKTACELHNDDVTGLNKEYICLERFQLKLDALFEMEFSVDDLLQIADKYSTNEFIEKLNIEKAIFEQNIFEFENDIESENSFINEFDTEQKIKLKTDLESNKRENVINNMTRDFLSFLVPTLLTDIKNDIKIRIKNNTLLCITCMNTNEVDDFKDKHGNIKQSCAKCREKMGEIELNRGKRARDYKPYEQNPERKLKKKQQREDNPEKQSLYQITYKAKSIANNENHWVDKANGAKNWRHNNPEKMKEFNRKRQCSISTTLEYYKNRAKNNSIKWDLTDEFATKLILSNCYYCEELDECGLNGIDKLYNNNGYTEENTVSCCETCNFMKGVVSEEIYLDKIRHILGHMHLSNEFYDFSHLFENHCSGNYNSYKKRALEKLKVDFDLTEDEFEKLKRLNCFMCDKESNMNNLNGVDRVDNKKGYTLNNCLPCCYDCNKIKNDNDICDVIRKMYKTIFPNKSARFINDYVQGHINTLIKHAVNAIKSENNDIQKKLEINSNKIAKQNHANNMIKKYGEVNAKRINALKEQIRVANKKGDIVKAKNAQAELDTIYISPKEKHEKKKATQEEKKKNEKLRKQKYRELQKELLGDEENRKRMADEKAHQREKKKLQQELNK